MTPPPGAGLGTQPEFKAAVANALELWQSAFHTEAMRCVSAMASVVDTANVSHFAHRFDDWRKADLKATAHMQQHVKELAKLNENMGRFLEDVQGPEGLPEFKECLVQLRKVDRHIEGQQQLWQGLDRRLDHLQEELRSMGAQLCRQSDKIDVLQTAEQAQAQAKVLSESSEDLGRVGVKIAEQMVVKFRLGCSEDLAEMKAHFAATLDEGGAIRRAMEAIDEKLVVWETATRAEGERWKQRAADLEAKVSEAESARRLAEEWRPAAQEAKDRSESLERRLQGLEAELGDVAAELDRAQAKSLVGGMRRLKDLEQRGNFQLDRATGEVSFPKRIDFVEAKAATECPPPKFADPVLADVMLKDVAEVLEVFEGSAKIEVHTKPGKGGTPVFWDEVAQSCANLAQTHLEALGVGPGRLEACGVAGSGGLNASCVLIKLDSSLFADAVATSKAGKGGARGAPAAKKR